MNTHTLKHYKIQPDGTLKLIRTEIVPDAPRPLDDPFAEIAYRDAADRARTALEAEAFETLVDAACASAE